MLTLLTHRRDVARPERSLESARDLGHLLMKHPDRAHASSMTGGGEARVFFPVATDEVTTAALVVELDPLGIVRHARQSGDGDAPLAQYVNEHPYVPSSFTSVAISRVLGSALNGRCRDRPDLPERVLALEVELPVLACRGGAPWIERLFGPLGYDIESTRLVLDERFPEWGPAPFYRVRLQVEATVQDVLTHLYVLLPVLADTKHYWVADDEIDKLVDKAQTWLAQHPEREWIVSRYMKRQARLARLALLRLPRLPEDADAEDAAQAEAADARADAEEEALERPASLNEVRLETVERVLVEAGAADVVDLGCGEGRLLRRLQRNRAFTRLRGVDVSSRVLGVAAERLRLARLPERQQKRLQLLQGSALYRDERLADAEAIVLVEVIEHVDAFRLPALEAAVFGLGVPVVVVTTPNVEYNARFPDLAARPGVLRHTDHRFEWTRAQFQEWAARVATTYGYALTIEPIGALDPALGAPTQMGVFAR